jgi:L-lactate dehydrogenase complex protein LldE
MRVSLFITCFNDSLFPDTGRATVRLLERLGHEVEFREQQTCCGQIHRNSGYELEAQALADRFGRVFEDAEAIVTPSASCAGSIAEAVPELAPRVHELSRFLTDVLGVEDVGASFDGRVCYHPTCHSLRALRVGDAPLRLLRAVRGLELVELEGADECCGFGGTFAVKNPDVSSAMLDDKLAAVERTGARVVTALDSSCLMHIGGGLHRRGSAVRTMHLAEILAS